jgi:tetratricopeptide (TPR) repeat protein
MKSSRHNTKKKNNLYSAAAVKVLEHEIAAAWAVQDLEKSIHLLHQVLEADPQSAKARLFLGRVHGVLYDYDKAIEWFDQAVDSVPPSQRIATLIEAGKTARNLFDPSIAESFFEEAAEMSKTPEAKLALAEFYTRIRKRESAKALVDEVIRAFPKEPFASFVWTLLYEDRFQECVDRLTGVMKSQGGELKAKAGYQLAKILDKAGDYDGAMRALAEAKSVFMSARNEIVQQRRSIRARHWDLAQKFTVSKRQEWQDALEDLGPKRRIALLGGHPRSGTTLLEQVLDSHPDMISAEEAENFGLFSLWPIMRAHETADPFKGMDESTVDELKASRERYFSAIDRCLGEPVGSRLLIDKNPSLTSLVPAMFRVFPEIKYITMLRDPRDVLISCYMQSFVPVSGVNGNYLTLQDTAEEYVGVMRVWSEVADRFDGHACEVRYEDMVEDLEGNAKRVLDFLGVEWSDSIMDYDRHAREKVVRSPTAEAVTEKVHTRAKNRWKNYEKHLEPVLETLRPCLKSLGYE